MNKTKKKKRQQISQKNSRINRKMTYYKNQAFAVDVSAYLYTLK